MALETRLRLRSGPGQRRPSGSQRSDNDYLETYGTIAEHRQQLLNKNYWPEATASSYPVYNDINFDDDYVKLTGETFGVTIGLDIYFTRKTTLSLAYENFSDDKALNAALNFRF